MIKEDLKLSIVIPLYNSENYIVECLDSIQNQNVIQYAFEIIIINDGSTDKSLEIVENYSKNYTNIKIDSQINRGCAAARNNGIKKASGEYIFFIDSDDYIASNTLNILMNKLNDVDLLTFKSIQTSENNLRQSSTNISKLTISKVMTGIDFIAIHGFKDAVGWFIVKKKFLIKSNIFYLENRMLEDISFNIELLSKAKKVVYFPLDVYRYVSRHNSIMTKKDSIHFERIISDYERVIMQLNSKIEEIKGINPKAAKKMKNKRKVYHFFLFMRFTRSDLNFNEIKSKINSYKGKGLYPLDYYSNKLKVKLLIFIFNKKLLFFFFIKIYRVISQRSL